MINLPDLYTDFFRIDFDARGGYARVADVVAHQENGVLIHRAFKLMRHELEKKQVGIQRFENEFKILAEVTKDKQAPPAITRIYDSGFAPVELSQALHNLHEGERLSPKLDIVSTGTDIQKFLEMKSTLLESEPDRWLPYLVVELAPYGDGLLRQIKPQSESDFSNIHRLPVNTIIEMALQLLEVMDYLHRKLQYAYIDWKPEHIYWNESINQLKLIDWNVTNRLPGNPKEKQKTIHEDLRMFCGAALYCSLALTDPEDLNKAIGPTPTIPRNLVPAIPPRYWTDKPNFYQRDSILDEKIKQLVQKGLDPKQGFNSPQELKSALIQYADQRKNRRQEQNDAQNNADLIARLPVEAVQHYRRARSYIAAEDYDYAGRALERAMETARLAGMVYPDAQRLLRSVQNILEAGEFRQKVKLALELEQWQEALNLYRKAIALEPANTTMKKEFEGLQELLRSESGLRNKGVLRIFTNIHRLRRILESTRDIFNPENRLYNSAKQQLNQIRLIQWGGIFTLLIVFVGLGWTGNLKFPGLIPVAATTRTPTVTPSRIPTQTFTATEPPVTPTMTLTAGPTDTPEPVVTATVVQSYGMLNVSFFYPVADPNGKRIGVALEINQLLAIVDSKINGDQLWYKCIWEAEGVAGEGWILAKNVQFVPPPTPTP